MTITLIADGLSSLNNSTVSVTSTVAADSGDTIVVGVLNRGARTVSSLSDGGINSYTQAKGSHTNSGADIYYTLASAAALPVGTVFTITLSGSSQSKHVSVWKINPPAGAVSDSGAAVGTSTTPSVSTAGSVVAGSSVFGIMAAGDANPTNPASPWVDDYSDKVSSAALATAHQIPAADGVVTYDPTLDASKPWDAVIAAFQESTTGTTKYWVGGSATWDGTAGSKWSLTSGGAGGAGVPSIYDPVVLDANSGAVTVTVSGARNCASLTCTGFTGTLAGTAGNSLNVAGSVTLAAGMTYTLDLITMLATAAANLTTAGKSLVNFTVQNSAGIACTLQDALTCSGTLTIVAGSLDANNKNISVAAFNSNYTSTRALLLGSGTWTLTGTGDVWLVDGTMLTLTPSTSTIKLNNASASSKAFTGGSKTYYNLWLTGAGTGAFIIAGSNTFNDLTMDTPPHTLRFEGGASTTVTTASVSGTALAGNNTIASTTSSPWDINCAGGLSVSYVSLQNSHAHGGDFTAANSYDGGGNLTWVFTASASTAIYFDSAYQYNSSATATITGLNWLIGETLGVVADGVDIGDATVNAAGTLTLPDGLTGSVITVGKRYLSRGVTLRAPQTGNADGSSLGRQMAVKSVAIDMLNSAGIEAGTLSATEPVPGAWKQTGDGDLYTGMFDVPVDDSHENEGVVVFQTDRGYPAIIRAVQFGIESEP